MTHEQSLLALHALDEIRNATFLISVYAADHCEQNAKELTAYIEQRIATIAQQLAPAVLDMEDEHEHTGLSGMWHR